MPPKITVIFDFDRTLIEDDSDRWVISKMGLTDLFNQLRTALPWTSLMDTMAEELHSRGCRIESIQECLKGVPLHPRTAAAIKSAHALGCDLKIISDANVLYIETILKHHGLFDCFSEIISNPTKIDEHGRLKIFPFHDLAFPHGCNLCPPNMCKGLVIERIQGSLPEHNRNRFIYLGDGRGDFCPILKLNQEDHVMPRKLFPLWECISQYRTLVKAQVHNWLNAEELEQTLLHLTGSSSGEPNEDSSVYEKFGSNCS